nr:hypothetical protein [Candidatus Baldrarchaeota archaeon]
MKQEAEIAIISTSPSSKCGIGIYTENLYGALPENKSNKIIVLSETPHEGKLRYEKTWKKGLNILSPINIFRKILKKN